MGRTAVDQLVAVLVDDNGVVGVPDDGEELEGTQPFGDVVLERWVGGWVGGWVDKSEAV